MPLMPCRDPTPGFVDLVSTVALLLLPYWYRRCAGTPHWRRPSKVPELGVVVQLAVRGVYQDGACFQWPRHSRRGTSNATQTGRCICRRELFFRRAFVLVQPPRPVLFGIFVGAFTGDLLLPACDLVNLLVLLTQVYADVESPWRSWVGTNADIALLPKGDPPTGNGGCVRATRKFACCSAT